MKREIIFRGKRADNCEWIEGSLVTPNRLISGVYILQDCTYGDLYPGYEDVDDININDYKNDGIALGRFREVDPSTVGQFTGLLDKEGNRIFEGDLLKDVALGDDVVYTADWKGCLRGTSKMGTRLACDHPRRISSHFKVVGNSFDHPHLLNKQTSNQ